MKRNIALVVFALTCIAMLAQTPFLEFNFTGDTMVPSTGTGTMTIEGGVTSSWVAGYTGNPDRALNTTNYPAQGVANTGSGVKIVTSTAGNANIVITWQIRNSNTAANRARLQYTTDGSNWLNFDADNTNAINTQDGNDLGFDNGLYIAGSLTNVTSEWYVRSANFTGIPAVNNNPNFGVRFLTAFPSGSNQYVATTSTQNYAPTSGTVRFDNVTFLSSDANAVAAPTASPAGGNSFTQPISVTLSCATEQASIRYTTDGSNPSPTVGTVYETPINISATTTLKFIAYKEGMNPSAVVTQTYTFILPPQTVQTIAELKAGQTDNTTLYTIANPVIVSFTHNNRYQKFVQDGTAGLLIDDYTHIITTNYAIGDAITGLTGTIEVYSTGQFQFHPTADPGPATSSGNAVAITDITAEQLNTQFDTYDSQLVRLTNVHFVNPTGNFANGQNYPMQQWSTTFNFYTNFYDTSSNIDYIGQPIPTGNIDLVGLPTKRSSGIIITPRYLSDMSTNSNADITIAPNGNKLIGNYPNPFNPSTTIAFELATPSNVNIAVYNVKGQKVKELFNGEMPQGSHTVIWNGDDTPSGIYFYRMTTNEGVQVKRAVLLK